MTSPDRIKYEQVVLKFQPLVRSIALAMVSRMPACVDLDDLFQDGTIGLLDAVERYDPTKGTEITTFISARIRGAMIDGLRRLDAVPREDRKKYREALEAQERVNQRLLARGGIQEVAEEMNIPLADLQSLQTEVSRFTISVQQEPGSETDAWDAAEVDAHEAHDSGFDEKNPLDALGNKQFLRDVYESTTKLTPRQHEALGHFLLDKDLRETAVLMHVTESRVCQIWNELVRKLRKILREDYGHNHVPLPEDEVCLSAERAVRKTRHHSKADGDGEEAVAA